MLKRMFLFIVFVLASFTFFYGQENNIKKFTGTWKGVLDMQGQTYSVILNIVEKGGKLTGTIESPEQGGGVVIIENVAVEGNKIQFEISAIKGGYDGTLKEEKKMLDGSLIINEQGVPFSLIKDEKSIQKEEIKFTSVWEGTLIFANISLKIVFKTYQKEDGTLGGMLDSPDQKVSNIPADKVVCNDETLSFEIGAIGASFSGKIDKATMTAKGAFNQRGQDIPLDLKKTEQAVQK